MHTPSVLLLSPVQVQVGAPEKIPAAMLSVQFPVELFVTLLTQDPD